MKIALVTDHTYLPDRAGGRESSINDLSNILINQNHDVRVIANRGSIKYFFYNFIKRIKWKSKYKIDRVKDEFEFTKKLISHKKVDIVIYNIKNENIIHNIENASSIKKIFYIRDVENLDSIRGISINSNILFIANSKFVSNKIYKYTNRQSLVIPPLIDENNYLTTTNKKYVTFINPVKEKGLDLALEIAYSCKEIPFLFVECWPLSNKKMEELQHSLSKLPNVKLVRASHDMKTIYSQTGILLVPSMCEEAFGRVVIEAQISGIPVIASNIGGLPESVGEGGILIDPNNKPDTWSRFVRDVWHSDKQILLSDKARINSTKHLFNQNISLNNFLSDVISKP